MFSYTRKILDIMTHGNITRSSAFAEMVATPSVFAGIDNLDSMCSVTQAAGQRGNIMYTTEGL